jgi:hypothetical protein
MSGHHYNTAHNANKHMLQEHNLQVGSPELYPTKFGCTVAGCAKTFASTSKRDHHVTGHTTKPKATTKRKTTTAAVSIAPAAAGTHASEIALNDVNGGDDDEHSNCNVEVKTTTAVATAPAQAVSLFEAQRQVNIAQNQAVLERMGLPALAAQVAPNAKPTAPKRRRTDSDSDSDYNPADNPSLKQYNLRRKPVSIQKLVSESEEATAEEAESEVEKAKVVPMEKTIDFCVVFGETGNGQAEVWFAVETEEEDEDEMQDDGDRCVRWLEQEDGVWRTQMATSYVGAEYVFTTKRVTLSRSAGGEAYELKAGDVPTDQEQNQYDEALKKKFAAPATLPARPSTARPSTPRTGESFSERKWRDVAEWQKAPENGGGPSLYHFTLKATECREGHYFLMSCTATPEPTASESENQRSFLVVGKVKTVTDQTFTYTLFSAASPANAYDSSCVEGGWVCETHAAQKEPANHSDVFMYFSALTKTNRLPAAAKDRARTLCAFLN